MIEKRSNDTPLIFKRKDSIVIIYRVFTGLACFTQPKSYKVEVASLIPKPQNNSPTVATHAAVTL
jgi:hypothetical protein